LDEMAEAGKVYALTRRDLVSAPPPIAGTFRNLARFVLCPSGDVQSGLKQCSKHQRYARASGGRFLSFAPYNFTASAATFQPRVEVCYINLYKTNIARSSPSARVTSVYQTHVSSAPSGTPKK
jgi:hypothetical protein